MKEVTTIGLDLAKRVFQVHGVDAAAWWRRIGRWASGREIAFDRRPDGSAPIKIVSNGTL